MSRAPAGDVYSVDELARAALVEPAAVDRLIASGELRPIAGTRYLAGPDALRAGRLLRQRVLDTPAAVLPDIFDVTARPPAPIGHRDRVRAFTSAFVHVALVATILLVTAGDPHTAQAVEEPPQAPRLVFLMTPGPGGGGGGGGLRNPRSAPKLERRGSQPPRMAVPAVTPDPVLTTARREEPPKELTPAAAEPKPVEKAPEPLPARVLVAPVVTAAPDPRDREGVIEHPRGDADSQGSGVGGGAGTGAGTGNGEGLGSGLGDGSGGGTGGGPFRPGAGIDPPRLLREVKADYTDEARRRGLQGDVVLEIVVRQDGSVGEVTVLQGLGSGLDQRAVAAVGQWRFAPARRHGTPVDVIVEVAVEFSLR